MATTVCRRTRSIGRPIPRSETSDKVETSSDNLTGSVVTTPRYRTASTAGRAQISSWQPVTFELSKGAVDVDGDLLRIVTYQQRAHGTVVCSTAGSCTYTPNPGLRRERPIHL